jgi:hypothetical protein
MQTESETMNKILITVGFLVAATSAAWAQDYYAPNTYGYAPYSYAPGVYDYAPGYSYAPGFGPYSYSPDPHDYDRVDQPGRGNSAESTR